MRFQVVKCPAANVYDVHLAEVKDSYEFISTTVEGLIECIHLPRHGADMWVNGEYLYTLNPERVNRIAMDIAIWEGMTHFAFQPILGNVVITGGVDAEGETLGLDDTQLESINEVLVEAIVNTEDMPSAG